MSSRSFAASSAHQNLVDWPASRGGSRSPLWPSQEAVAVARRAGCLRLKRARGCGLWYWLVLLVRYGHRERPGFGRCGEKNVCWRLRPAQD